MTQTWIINGRHYDRGQLEEYKAARAASAGKPVVKVEPVEEVEDLNPTVVVEKKINDNPYDSMKFFELKKMAKEQGMEVNPKTSKEEVLAFLHPNQ